MGNYRILTLHHILNFVDHIAKPMKFITVLNLLRSNGYLDPINYTMLLATAKSQDIYPESIIHPYKDSKYDALSAS